MCSLACKQVQTAQSEATQARAEAQQAVQQLAEEQAEVQRLAAAHEALIQESSQEAGRLARLEGRTPSYLSLRPLLLHLVGDICLRAQKIFVTSSYVHHQDVQIYMNVMNFFNLTPN